MDVTETTRSPDSSPAQGTNDNAPAPGAPLEKKAGAGVQAAAGAKETAHFSSRNLLSWFMLGLLGVGLYFSWILLRPFVDTLILAMVFAALFSPIYSWFLRRLKGRRSLAAFLVTLCVIVLVILPLALFIVGLIPQMRHSVTTVTAWLSGGQLDEIFARYLAPVFTWIHEEAPFFDLSAENAKADIIDASRRIGQTLLGFSANLLGRTVTFALHFLLFLLSLFFFVKDGSAMIARLKYLTPLREEQQERIISNLRRISRSVLLGGFLVAALQGIAGGLGLALVGIPALFWGTVMAFSSFVPVIGTGIVWIPAVGALLLMGEWKSAVFLGLWCGILVTSIDTVVRPLLM
ncbi:MAG: AI-2E family transporter, partial [Deltaproteobacteria bacterium]|nr:AI-2E family transporter [Deltaproteobacteria bacterium]